MMELYHLVLILFLVIICSILYTGGVTPFIGVLLSNPILRRLIWKYWYGKIASDYKSDDQLVFMNYGFAPQGEKGWQLTLPSNEADDQYCANLYQRVALGKSSATSSALSGKNCLEVGSGRGGGASFLARNFNPSSIIGVDFSSSAVALAQVRHSLVKNLTFQTGDAENLPFDANTFDLVINVESSHCYGNISRFISEVIRVLKVGGSFRMCDFRSRDEMRTFEALLRAQPGLKVIEIEDITPNVIYALEQDDERKRKQVLDKTSLLFRNLMAEFAGLKGGVIYEGFKARSILYYRFECQKVVQV
jgi:ubiquinone/menaquinone biosynthesis C-methylase UbiE